MRLRHLSPFIIGLMTYSQAQASGFAIIEQSASGMGNAFSGGSAIAEDATTIYFNPAGMTRLKGNQFLAAGHAILPSTEFADSNSRTAAGAPLIGSESVEDQTGLVPNIYAVWKLKDAAVGLGINAPFGLGNKYDDTWIGRYHAVESDLRTININPSFAMQATEKFSVGFGVNLVFADVTLSNAIDFGTLLGSPQANDGFVEITGDNKEDFGFGWNFGFLYQLNQKTRVGYAYRSFVDLTLEGRADFAVPAAAAPIVAATGQFVDTDVLAETRLPQSASLSLVHDVNDKFSFMADVLWTRWSVFDELRIQFANPVQEDGVSTMNWKNSTRYSLGANFRVNDQLMFRGGLAFDETPIQDMRSARIPGNDRTWIAVGFQYKFNDKFGLDMGYSHLFIGDTPIDSQLETSQPPLNAILEGNYDASVDIFSTQIVWNF